MKISKEEFEALLKEDQELILQLLAESETVSPNKFFKVAGFMEYLNLFGGVLYDILQNSSNKPSEDK